MTGAHGAITSLTESKTNQDQTMDELQPKGVAKNLEPVLPPELFLPIMNRLEVLDARGTLFSFCLASRQCYALGQPSLLRRVLVNSKNLDAVITCFSGYEVEHEQRRTMVRELEGVIGQ